MKLTDIPVANPDADVTAPWEDDVDIAEYTAADFQSRDAVVGIRRDDASARNYMTPLTKREGTRPSVAMDRAIRVTLGRWIDAGELPNLRQSFNTAVQLPPAGWDADVQGVSASERVTDNSFSPSTTPVVRDMLDVIVVNTEYETVTDVADDCIVAYARDETPSLASYHTQTLYTRNADVGLRMSEDTDDGSDDNPYVIDDTDYEKDDELAMDCKYNDFRPVTELFARKTRRKLIRWLLEQYEKGNHTTYSKSDIYDKTNVSRQSQIDQWPILYAHGLCRITGKKNNRRYGIPDRDESLLAELHSMQQFWDDQLQTDRIAELYERQ